MKKLIIIIAILLTGCASKCQHHCLLGFGPGNSLFDSYANYVDSTDPCQYVGKPEGYNLPRYCGSGTGKTLSIVPVSNTTFIINRR